MNTIIKTHKDIIAMLGGAHKLSGLMVGDYEQDYHKVRKWAARNSIPVKYWHELMQIAQRLDLPLTSRMLSESVTRKEVK